MSYGALAQAIRRSRTRAEGLTMVAFKGAWACTHPRSPAWVRKAALRLTKRASRHALSETSRVYKLERFSFIVYGQAPYPHSAVIERLQR